MCEMVERRGPAVITARCQDQSNQSRPSVVNVTGHHPRSPRLPSPPLLSKITCDRDATRSPSPLRSRPPPNPIGPVATPLHRTAEARREPRNQADRPSQSIRRVKWARRGAGRAAWRPRAAAADRRRGWATGTSTWARAGTGAPSPGSSPPPASSSAPGGSPRLRSRSSSLVVAFPFRLVALPRAIRAA